MGTVYILGAGFSKTCGIATDLDMLDSLIPVLAKIEGENGEVGTGLFPIIGQVP